MTEYSQLQSELQNAPEAAPLSRTFSVSEELARYGSPGLTGIELLTLIVGKEFAALGLDSSFRLHQIKAFSLARHGRSGVGSLLISYKPLGTRDWFVNDY